MKFLQYLKNHPSALAGVSIAAALLAGYGLMLPFVGIYGDDWGYFWLMFKGEGLYIFLRNNREAITPMLNGLAGLLGPSPLAWQLVHLALRWLVVFLFWQVLHQIWPQKRTETMLISVLLALYPGYKLIYVAVNMLVYSFVLICLLLSFYLNILAIRHPRGRWPLLAGALLCSFINLTLTEYYFFAEMIRPVLLFLFLSASIPTFWPRIRQSVPVLASVSGSVHRSGRLASAQSVEYQWQLFIEIAGRTQIRT